VEGPLPFLNDSKNPGLANAALNPGARLGLNGYIRNAVDPASVESPVFVLDCSEVKHEFRINGVTEVTAPNNEWAAALSGVAYDALFDDAFEGEELPRRGGLPLSCPSDLGKHVGGDQCLLDIVVSRGSAKSIQFATDGFKLLLYVDRKANSSSGVVRHTEELEDEDRFPVPGVSLEPLTPLGVVGP
jgi:hypothetical protein